MQIGLFASDAALAEYFVTALGFSGHAVTLYSSIEDLFSVLSTDTSLHPRTPDEVLLIELVLDDDGKRMIAELCRLIRGQRLPLIVLTTSDKEAIALTQTGFPGLCIGQLPIRLGELLPLIQAQRSSFCY
ncbi:MAG TPA: hypothetical protein VFB12_00085 [Ktedonobacteraceae bacterium]|nr:hypothetical protein [Ktedonobacteraceae bacterium]